MKFKVKHDTLDFSHGECQKEIKHMEYQIQIINAQEPMDAQAFYQFVTKSTPQVLGVGNAYAKFVAQTVSVVGMSEAVSPLKSILNIVPFSQSVEVYTEGTQRIGARIVITPDVGSFNRFTVEMLCAAIERGESALTKCMQELTENAVQG